MGTQEDLIEKVCRRLQGAGNYTLGEIVLSQKAPFTTEDIAHELQEYGVSTNLDELDIVLKRYRDNGIIVRRGHQWALSQIYAR